MKAMILAAGAGSRLGHLTAEVPKPMLDVEGQPLLAYILSNLARHGFRDVILNLHHHPQAIPSHFGQGAPWGLRLTYLREDHLLGTAGSVKNAAGFLDGEEPFLVHYGDLITDQDFTAMLAFHRSRGALATLLTHQRTRSNSIVCVDEQGRVERLLERPTEAERAGVDSPWVNSGIYLFDPQVLYSIPPGVACDFPRDILPGLVAQARVFAFPLTGYRCAIDSPERLEQARAEVRAGRWQGTIS